MRVTAVLIRRNGDARTGNGQFKHPSLTSSNENSFSHSGTGQVVLTLSPAISVSESFPLNDHPIRRLDDPSALARG